MCSGLDLVMFQFPDIILDISYPFAFLDPKGVKMCVCELLSVSILYVTKFSRRGPTGLGRNVTYILLIKCIYFQTKLLEILPRNG